MDPNVLWVSKDPEMWFSWDEEDPGFQGELVIGQDTLSIGVGFRGGVADVLCFESSDEALTGRTLFGGGFKLEEERFTIEVDRDNVGLFDEDLPTITFQKQERQGSNSSVSPDMT